MEVKHHFDSTGECWRMERDSVDLFRELAESKGWKLTPATQEEDMYEHWDFIMYRMWAKVPLVEYKVDIKGAKKIDRWGVPDDSLILVEYTNVNGYPGWLRGEARYIAFLLNEGFYFVDRKTLLEYTMTVVDWDLPPEPSSLLDKCGHIVYQRSQWGRQDLFTYLTKEEIVNLSFRSWRI